MNIKSKFLFTSIALITAFSFAKSQNLIPQIGMTFSRHDLAKQAIGPNESKDKTRLGFFGGIGTDVPVTDKVHLQTGIFYVQKGGKSGNISKVDGRVYMNNYDSFLEYIDIPLRSKIVLKEMVSKQLYIKAGVNVSYWIGGSQDYYYSYDSPNGGPPSMGSGSRKMKYDRSLSGNYRDIFYMQQRVDIGLHAGLGVLLKKQNILLDIGYTYGLSSFEFTTNTFASNRVFQLSAGVPFKVSKDIEDIKLAANDPHLKFYLGFSAGPSTTTLVGTEIDFRLDDAQGSSFEDLTSVSFAFHAKMEFFHYLFLKSGLGFIKKGAREINSRFTYPYDVEINYLSIPLTVGFQPFNFSNTKFINLSAEAGLSVNKELSGNKRDLGRGLFPGTPVETKKTVIASQVCLSAEVKISRKLIVFLNYIKFADLNNFYERRSGGFTYDMRSKGKLLSGGVMIALN